MTVEPFMRLWKAEDGLYFKGVVVTSVAGVTDNAVVEKTSPMM